MRRVLPFECLHILCCNRKPRMDRLTHESARYAAECYYAWLIEGRYADCASVILRSDSMGQDFRNQMTDLMAQHAQQIQSQRGGILTATSVSDSLSGNEAQIFLNILYADSTAEQVDMLMVFQDGKWWIQ